MDASARFSRSLTWHTFLCCCGMVLGLSVSAHAQMRSPLGAVLVVRAADVPTIFTYNDPTNIFELRSSGDFRVLSFAYPGLAPGTDVQIRLPRALLQPLRDMNFMTGIRELAPAGGDPTTVAVVAAAGSYISGSGGSAFYLIPKAELDAFNATNGGKRPFWYEDAQLTETTRLMAYDPPDAQTIQVAGIGFDARSLNPGAASTGVNVVPAVTPQFLVYPGTPQPTPQPSGLSFRLTDSLPIETGAVWYPTRQYIAGGFVTTFQFQITNPRSWQAGVTPGGDGFAFVIQNYSQQPLGPGGGFLGYQGIPDSLAVEFDTYWNKDDVFFDPYEGRYVPIDDPDGNHISVHTRGTAPNSVSELYSIGRVSPATNLKDGARHLVQIFYQPGALSISLDDQPYPVLTVTVGPDGSPLDLARLLALPDGRAWFGFTAGTGAASENHDIISWDFRVFSNSPF